ncbi:MAG: single-stranded DNA-binding protein [Candidatus Sumerlaeaceae bacterium]|nr:single-stranded DNA-binding protein [Candidatus Sumerlaeaceae bacterium]
MLSLNKVMVTGRVTRDAEVRFLPSGTAVTTFSVAVNRRFIDSKTNEWREETLFLDVETWGKLAERCGEVLKKGTPVYVEGRLRSDSYENREGQRVTKIKVVAERVSPFEVPGRATEPVPEELNGDFDASSLPPAEASPKKPQGGTSPGAPVQGTGQQGQSRSPVDGLDFDSPSSGQRSVDDDIPF